MLKKINTKIGKITIFDSDAVFFTSKMNDKIYISIFQFKISVQHIINIYGIDVWGKKLLLLSFNGGDHPKNELEIALIPHF